MARIGPWALGVNAAAGTGHRCVIALIAVATVFSAAPARSADLWESLTDSEQKAAIEKLQGLLKEDLERDDARLVRNPFDRNAEGQSEADDPVQKAILKEISELDVQRLAQAAGSLSAGDPRPLRDAAIAAGLTKIGGKLKEWSAEGFEKDGVGRLVFSTLADQTDVYKEVLTALFDPAQSWCDVANVAWIEAKKAGLKASQESAETIAKKTINWVLGEGPLAALGATPGDAYLALLSLETEYFQALPRRLGAQAGGRIFEMYWTERAPPPRGAGKPEDAAWDAIEPYLAGSDGRWFLELAGSEATARGALDRCFREGSSNVFLCLDRKVEAKRSEAWSKLCTETAAAGEPTRAGTARKLAWLSETLRRLIEERLAARGASSLAQAQTAAGRARTRLGDLRRLGEEQARLCERRDLDSLAGAARGAFAALDALSSASQALPVWRLDGCAGAAAQAPEGESRARELSRRVRSRVAEADAASTAACSWPDPASLAAAQDNLRTAARAGDRVRSASAEARSALGELEALAAAARAGPPPAASPARLAELHAARDEVRAGLGELARGPALADACRAARVAWEQRSGRLGQLDLAIQGMAEEVLRVTGETGGLREGQEVASEADAIKDRSGDCVGRRDALRSVSFETRESAVAVHLTVISGAEKRARAVLAACAGLDAPTPTPSSNASFDAELAAARGDVARLDSYQGTVFLCVGSATSWVERLRQAGNATPASGSTTPPETSSAGSGWAAVGEVKTVAVGTGGSTSPAGGPAGAGGAGGAGGTSPTRASEADAAIRAAVDAYDACQMGAALGHARRAQALAPDHPWLAANLGLIARRQEAQARSAAALADARVLADAGDLSGALAAATRAANDAPSCMTGAISGSLNRVRGQASATRADELKRNREVFVQMVDSWISAWTAAATAGMTPAGGPGGGAGGGAPAAPRQVACSTTTEQGSDTPETVMVSVGNASGTAAFRWEFYDVKDRLVVEYGGATLLDTGCVGGRGSRPLPLGGFGGQAVVRVFPNCEAKSTTKWEFTLECPR